MNDTNTTTTTQPQYRCTKCGNLTPHMESTVTICPECTSDPHTIANLSEFIDMVYKKEQHSGASSAGFHFYKTYMDCPRLFFFKYVLNLETIHTGRALTYGKLMHVLIEYAYRGYPLCTLQALGNYFMVNLQESYKDLHEYETDLERVPKVLEFWYNNVFMPDKDQFDVIEIEQTHELPLQYGNSQVIITGRIDQILRDKNTGILQVHDLKSTGWSINKPIQTATALDQMTCYTAMAMHKYNEHAVAYINAIYSRKNKYDWNIQARKDGPITYPSHAYEQFKRGMLYLIKRITEEVSMFESELINEKTPYADEYYFARHGKNCSDFTCDYAEVCRLPAYVAHRNAHFKRTQNTELSALIEANTKVITNEGGI